MVWVFDFFFFFLAALVNISKCHKIEQHKETYAAPTEFTSLENEYYSGRLSQLFNMSFNGPTNLSGISEITKMGTYTFIIVFHLRRVVGKMTSFNCCNMW